MMNAIVAMPALPGDEYTFIYRGPKSLDQIRKGINLSHQQPPRKPRGTEVRRREGQKRKERRWTPPFDIVKGGIDMKSSTARRPA